MHAGVANKTPVYIILSKISRLAGIAMTDVTFSSGANDLKASRDALVDAAAVSLGLWLSYIFVLLYFLIAVSGISHLDLLFENPVKLPFLSVALGKFLRCCAGLVLNSQYICLIKCPPSLP